MFFLYNIYVKMTKIRKTYKLKFLILLAIIFSFFFSQENSARISNKYEVKVYWEEQPIVPRAAKYFIRTEKIEKNAKPNNHPIKIPPQALKKMLRELSYKYDRDKQAIPLFSKKELELLSKHATDALRSAKSTEDVTFVVKGLHSSARWAFAEERLTTGRIFVANSQLNLILGSVQLSLQPTIAERYEGNVWETTKINPVLGFRSKVGEEYEGIITVYDEKQKGIYRKSAKRKDWFVFTNVAYQRAMDTPQPGGGPSQKEYESLQKQIDQLQKNINRQQKQPNRQLNRQPNKPQQRQQLNKTKKQNSVSNKDEQNVIEERLKTLDSLYKKGILSESEYKRKRKEILGGI